MRNVKSSDHSVVIPDLMTGVLLTGHGGFDKLEYREDIPVPRPGRGEVLIRVAAAGINNTDINTRIGWYSKAVNSATEAGAAQGFEALENADATWSGTPMTFPRIQGGDCCGRIVEVGDGVDPSRIGDRVIVRNIIHSYADFKPMEGWVFGSECDGAFAQYTKVPSIDADRVECDWSDIELASMPVAYSTAENMLHRAGVKRDEHVIITGASGGVGSAAIQLAKRRGAIVTAIAGASKLAQLRELGADRVIPRGDALSKHLGNEVADVAIDVAAGPGFAALLNVLKKGGRYAVAGAIAGPIVELDVRTLYLKDLTFYGCTIQAAEVSTNLVSYIENGEIRPFVGKTYPLRDIVNAQKDFLSKTIPGKLVLVIPH